jgi:hypothetical protein
MPIDRFGQISKFVPILAPVDATSTTKITNFVNVQNAHRCTFLIPFGVITSSSTTASPAVTVIAASTAASTGGVAIPFSYRKSAAVGTDTWGAVTAVAATGVTMTLTDDGMALLIDVDPINVANAATTTTAKFVAVKFIPNAYQTVCLLSAMAMLEPRYAQTSMVGSS